MFRPAEGLFQGQEIQVFTESPLGHTLPRTDPPLSYLGNLTSRLISLSRAGLGVLRAVWATGWLLGLTREGLIALLRHIAQKTKGLQHPPQANPTNQRLS